MGDGGAVRRDLGDGLILRRATVADTEALAAFNATIFMNSGASKEDSFFYQWTRDLMSGGHPTTSAGDFTLVEDTRTGAIVSSLVLIGQTWSYDGIEFGVGLPELVATHPEYRRRGLVRAQFEVIHAWSAARGQKLQAISGIPWFYRQFGYEMGLALGGGRIGTPHLFPRLAESEPEPYRIRPAGAPDLPFIAEVYRQATRRDRIASVRDLSQWQYELSGRGRTRREMLHLVEAVDGEPVGFVMHPNRWGTMLEVGSYELKAGVSWLAVTPSVLRYLKRAGEEQTAREPAAPCQEFRLMLGEAHPAYEVLPHCLPQRRKPYAWYVRVADLPDFLRHVAPALERRLEQSALAGHTGELGISFYREGLRLVFERGRLTQVEPWAAEPAQRATAYFPDLTFLQLLLGYRSLEELEYAFADCAARDDGTRALLTALFPKQGSNVWAIM